MKLAKLHRRLKSCLIIIAESTEKEESCLFQPREVIFNKTEESAVLFCNVSNCHHQNLDYQWFVFRENYHCRVSETTRYRLKGASLQIRSLNANDSGVYLCAVKSRSEEKCCRPHVGLGTTLVVRERVKIMKTHVILWLFFALLAIYSLTLVALIILKKVNPKLNILRNNSRVEVDIVAARWGLIDSTQRLQRTAADARFLIGFYVLPGSERREQRLH
uniref:Ig-like domain-containing protein n=1 Tax=Kryptolebias marmoratus TaxID=37003 RepID=A0A3Q3BK34_KRYMA